MPALVLNYFGQGALVHRPTQTALENPFYRLYPDWALMPMLILSTFATVIASQAVITGAFSLTRQAIQLGLVPRFEIRHTSESMAGQIYMPRVNWFLFVAVLVAVALFRTSSQSAAAYGVSVTAAMVIDTMMAFFVIWKCWKWPLWRTVLLIVPLLLIEQAFFSANILKLFEGGWVPIDDRGRARAHHVHLGARHEAARQADQAQRGRSRLAGAKARSQAAASRAWNGRIPHRRSDAAPTSMMHNLKHNKVMHERNMMLTIRTEETPRVARHERVTVERVSDHFIRIIARYGFMETPSVPKILEHARRKDLQHRHRLDVVLPVAAVTARDDQVRDAALAGAAVHCARQQCRGRDDLLPDSDRSRRRGRNASASLIGSG